MNSAFSIDHDTKMAVSLSPNTILCLVAQTASECGTTAAVKFFEEKYSDLPWSKETTIHWLKDLYQEYLWVKPSEKEFEEFLVKIHY